MDMETLQTIKNYFLDDEFFTDDFDAKQNLTNQITGRFQKSGGDFKGKHFYSLKITKIPTRTNYHQFTFEKLQDISRKLTNGLTTYGSIPNRKYWNKYFIGGVRTISIKQEKENEYPSFTLNYLVYSDYDNLDVRIKTHLFTRIRMVDLSLEISFDYLGSYNQSVILDNIEHGTEVDFSSPSLQKLGDKNLEDIYNNQFQRPRFFGRLFKPNRI